MRQYLVGSAGRLLLILGFGEQEDGTASFQVLDIDLDVRKWTELVSLFMGFNSSFSLQVDESKQSIKPN
ncbi:hypothetical protein EUGRSUZ_H00544 [Eucalyptus grandis]|uniref:Uncharacterized protein n=2 Tax=Eucalyptus grandis TaxID=71139 RepID=A0ACC3JLL1_EUCGR|nr:hypothetical protein EUGRSUZ_H00544 [Eucalyptus grandis]